MELRRHIRAITLPGWAIVALLAAAAAIALAGCIVEGCTYPYETGATAEVPMQLDAAHPVATTRLDITISQEAFASDVPDHGARLQLTIDGARRAALALVLDGSAVPIPLVTNNGVVSLPLDQCQPDVPCALGGIVIVSLASDDPAPDTQPVSLKVEALARVPHTEKKCGLGPDPVQLTTTPAQLRTTGSFAGTQPQVHDASELVQHVTVRFPAVDDAAGAGVGVLNIGHLRIDPDPKPPAGGFPATSVPGLWLRVTPDDGGPPVLDAPVPSRYPVVPADATFPIDATCDGSCERGYWIQAVVYDAANHRFGEPDTAIYQWSFDARTSAAGSASAGPPVAVDLDASDRAAPPSLVMTGTGPAFRVDADHPATTLAIDASAPVHAERPVGDALGDVTIVFRLTTTLVDPDRLGHGNQASRPGQPWLSNGHYVGDGTDADDAADRGATGGPATVASPPGRPFAACAGQVPPCHGRIGLVQRWYSSDFDPSVPYDVAWTWTVVGAPPGTVVSVQPLAGETLDPGAGALGGLRPVAFVAAAIGAGILAVLAIRRSRSRRQIRLQGRIGSGETPEAADYTTRE